MVDRLTEPAAPLIATASDEEWPDVVRQRTPEEYQALVVDAVEEIRAGEAFQIVGSQRFEVPCTADPLDVYRVLRRTNPSPYPVSYTHLDVYKRQDPVYANLPLVRVALITASLVVAFRAGARLERDAVGVI